MGSQDQKNFIIAVSLSLLIFFGWDHFFGVKPNPNQQQQQAVQTIPQANTDQPQVQKESLNSELEDMVVSRDDAIKDNRIPIETPTLKGSINLKNGRLDDLTLLNYKVSVKEDSENIQLLNPKNTKDFYFVDFDVLAGDSIEKPTSNTPWQIQNGQSLTPSTPVTLFYENSQGIRFERAYSVDENYMMTIQQKVINNGETPIHIQQKILINRHKPNLDGTSNILHEGAVGFLNDHLIEKSYGDLVDKKSDDTTSKGGWIGFSDKYWLVALIPHSNAQSVFSFQTQKNEQFITSLKQDKKTLNPGETVEQSIEIFTGPKKLALLDAYEEKLNIKKFDLAIDFGMFYFLTKPLFQFLDWLYQLVGNFGIAIMIMTLISKIVLFPLANKSYYSMGRMKNLTPKMEQIKTKYADDPVKLQKEMMALYKKEKVNPLSGCLPMLIQAPIFFCLYKVLYISIEMRHAPFFGWIHDLSAPDPTTLFNLFGLIPWDPPSFLMIGLWPIVMGATMIIQQRLNPQPVDPAQAKMMLFMPIFFTYLFGSFPSGVVIYWTVSNILSIIQQKVIMNIAAKKGL
ncbi:MAG: membrane protein insertase YidC [Proteobacteria bacterium]|nr:membrane protein insertase YidC [Pseudomonadota bacterium]